MLLANVLGPQARALIGWQKRKPGVRLVSQRQSCWTEDKYRQELAGWKERRGHTVCNYGSAPLLASLVLLRGQAQPAKASKMGGKEPTRPAPASAPEPGGRRSYCPGPVPKSHCSVLLWPFCSGRVCCKPFFFCQSLFGKQIQANARDNDGFCLFSSFFLRSFLVPIFNSSRLLDFPVRTKTCPRGSDDTRGRIVPSLKKA